MFTDIVKLILAGAATLSIISGVGAEPPRPVESAAELPIGAFEAQTTPLSVIDEADVEVVQASSPNAVPFRTAAQFKKTVKMSSRELSNLTDPEKAELLDTKIVLADAGDNEYTTFEKVGSEQPAIQLAISEKACAGRHDFYRLVSKSGTNYCFANKGTMNFIRKEIRGHCPGNNRGQFKHYFFLPGGARWEGWTPERPAAGQPIQPPSKYSTCHWLTNSQATTSLEVRIK